MDKSKSHGDELKKDLDVLISKISAQEAAVTEHEKKAIMGILKILAQNQKHYFEEFEHLKKAIDLLTLQIFKMDQAIK
jgi:hypothetical protein